MKRELKQGFTTSRVALGKGVQHFTLNLQKVSSKAELMTALVDTLKLPKHFGHNWDALYDCLTDLSTDTVLELQEQAAFAQTYPELWEALEGVLLDAQQFLANTDRALWLVK